MLKETIDIYFTNISKKAATLAQFKTQRVIVYLFISRSTLRTTMDQFKSVEH